MKYPRNKPFIGFEEEYAVLRVMTSGQLQRGEVVNEFEKKFAEYTGKKHAIAVSSCTTGLQLAVECIVRNELGASRCVGVPDYTFFATGNVVHNLNLLEKVFDIDLDTYNMVIPEKDKKKCDIVIPVHCFGNPCILPKGKYYVIEDAACAVGSDGVGYGDIQVYSFHGLKVITTGLGGMITTNNKKWATWMRKKASHGKPDFKDSGYNYDISNLNAAIGIEQLKKLPYILERRRFLAKRYDKMLKGYCKPQVTNGSNYQSYVVRVPKEYRDKIIDYLRDNDIDAQIGTYSMTMVDRFRGKCLNGNRLYLEQICLPLYPQMSEDDQDYIVRKFIEVIGGYK